MCVCVIVPDVRPLLEALFSGDFRAVLQSPLIQELLCGEGGHVEEGTDVETHLEKCLLNYLSSAPDEEQSDR